MRSMVLLALLVAGCPSEPPPPPPPPWECALDGPAPFALTLGCAADFDQLASRPLDASIPGARSVKTVLDRSDEDALYFQDSNAYPLHWSFASAHLSLPDHPPVASLAEFNATEYFSPTRRFVLGAVTRYEGPGVWAWELSPYDTASAELIALSFRAVRDRAWFGDELRFHPTSEAIAAVAAGLPDDIPIVTTDELFAGIDYQPLNLATSMGVLRFVPEEEIIDVGFREVVVLDAVPNDIGVVAGLITATFQTPLSHVNVLAQNRGTPNMGLREAWTHPTLRALEGRWVELRVGAFEWAVREVTEAEADAWWEANRPEPADVAPMDTSVRSILAIDEVLDPALPLPAGLAAAIPAVGGKVAHFAALSGGGLPTPEALVVPVAFFDDFMGAHGLWDQLAVLLEDPRFVSDRVFRRESLAALRGAIETAPLLPDFDAALRARLAADFPDRRMRVRSSTNAEDVSGFNGAGLYTSRTYDPTDPGKTLEEAVRDVWASVYSDRAVAEREYHGIPQDAVGMALLMHRGFPEEEANGVAITANVFDPSGLEPAFYVNVQVGDASVVQPEPGTTTDQYLQYFEQNGQPLVYLAHSSLVPAGETVLTTAQAYELGVALDRIHALFRPVYGVDGGFYGMDVEFKFDASKAASALVIKQARPYPGWGSEP